MRRQPLIAMRFSWDLKPEVLLFSSCRDSEREGFNRRHIYHAAVGNRHSHKGLHSLRASRVAG